MEPSLANTKREFTTEVAPLPSAPPPSYDEACAFAGYQPSAAPYYPPTTPLMAENLVQATPVQQGNPVQPASVPHVNPQFPIQQVVPVTVTANNPRFLHVGRYPLKTTCPGCSHFISSRITVKNRCPPTFWCIVLFFTGICTLCSCCPYFCCDGPMKVDHFCPRCNAFLGTYVSSS